MSGRVDSGLVEQFTPRERQVLDLLQQGLPDAEIARRLDIARAGRALSQRISEALARRHRESEPSREDQVRRTCHVPMLLQHPCPPASLGRGIRLLHPPSEWR